MCSESEGRNSSSGISNFASYHPRSIEFRASRGCSGGSPIPLSILHERPQSGQRLVPLLGDEMQVFADFCDGLRIELEMALAAGANTVDNSRTLQDAEMLGDRLAGEPRAFGELRDRPCLTPAKF